MIEKFKSEKGAIPVVTLIILVIIVVGVGYGAYQVFKQKQVVVPIPSKSREPTIKPLEVNFSEAGNILNWDVQTESYTEDWRLLYEKPGAPALTVNLTFSENSICDLGEGEEVCDKSKLSNGDRARVDGNRSNDQVVVIKLEKL